MSPEQSQNQPIADTTDSVTPPVSAVIPSITSDDPVVALQQFNDTKSYWLNQISLLKAQATSISNDVKSSTSQRDANLAQIQSIQNQVTTLNDQVTGLNSKISDLETEITVRQNELNDLNTNQIPASQTNLVNIQTQITLAQTSLESLRQVITDLQNQIDASNTTLTALQSQIKSINDRSFAVSVREVFVAQQLNYLTPLFAAAGVPMPPPPTIDSGDATKSPTQATPSQ